MEVAAVTIYTTKVCPYCVRAKNLFRSLNTPFTEVGLDDKPELRAELSQKFHWRTVPMIVVGDEFLGGFDDVNDLHRRGELRPLLAA